MIYGITLCFCSLKYYAMEVYGFAERIKFFSNYITWLEIRSRKPEDKLLQAFGF